MRTTYNRFATHRREVPKKDEGFVGVNQVSSSDGFGNWRNQAELVICHRPKGRAVEHWLSVVLELDDVLRLLADLQAAAVGRPDPKKRRRAVARRK